jgi:hypothetical protein
LAEAVIEGVFEAEEFTDQGIVAAMSLVALMREQLIEVKFGTVIQGWRCFQQPGFAKTWACHADHARGYGVAVLTIVPQPLENAFGTGQSEEEF